VEFVEVQSRSVELREQLDPKTVAANAADLNLKLMKWRQVPSLDLEILKDTRCLLLGAGSLGCQVARNLVSWGFRKITFVDSGRVSYSNPVRQCLFTYEDSIKPENFKAPIAAQRLKEVFPLVEASGEVLKIPMPGHAVGANEEAVKELLAQAARLEELVQSHDVVFLLTDSRESRWLPTVLANLHHKPCLTIALGFETYLVMRHGLPADQHQETKHGKRLGCYFCNDVVAPRNSLRDRSLD
jgi:ubiquitin-like modifier-activating enzyme ATG7